MKEQTSKKTKKVKKNGEIDLPQPAWIFSPAVGDQGKQEVSERVKTVKYLKQASLEASHPATPPGELLQLIEAFLFSHGFDSTARLFAAERESKRKALNWESEGEPELNKGSSTLLEIYRSTIHLANAKAPSDTASESDTESGESGDSSSGSESSGSSTGSSDEDTVSESDSESSGDDSVEKPKKKIEKSKHHAISAASQSSDSGSSSSETSDDEDNAPPSKKTNSAAKGDKLSGKSKLSNGNAEDSDSTTNSSSSSSSDSEDDTKPAAALKANGNGGKNTLQKRKRSTSPKSSPAVDAAKKAKKNNIPFQRVPSDTFVDPKLSSNAYQSYDYADRAFQDLSVTKGKGFTKEKNKKKRGSYRGGTIDVNGGRSIRFED